MKRQTFPSKFALIIFSCAVLLAASSKSSAATATIVILNNDQPGVGFNDTTPVSPVGNNSGTTLGQQRLNAFQFAANLWGATLNSSVTITIRASWAALSCTSSSATLGSAGAVGIFRDFPNAPVAGTWYSAALANSIAGSDLSANPEINAQFNVNLGNTGCLDGTHFYLGLDNNHGGDVDLVTVLMHEFAHGLGFQTFTSSSSGTQNSGFPSVYDRFLLDNTSGKTWIQMTDAERQASAINTNNLVWTGSQVKTAAAGTLGTPRLRVNAPMPIAGNYMVGTADFGPHVTSSGTTGPVTYAIPNDGCTTLTNAGAVSGRIALIDRGNCAFVVKVKNAQNAGATGVIIANNDAQNPSAVIQMGGGDGTITIPSLMISFNNGTTLKTQLATLNTTLFLDTSTLGGADSQGRPLMYAPSPVQSGSSVSHWDTSEFPNQLMEPNISGDLFHSAAFPLVLTGSQLRDVGWSYNPIGDTAFYVRQHYFDFLGRAPDSSGFAFWTNDIFNCGIDGPCNEVHRINVSAAFFLSIEFQGTGNLVYKMWKAGFGNALGTPVAVRRAPFLTDKQTTQTTPNQVIVGQGDWANQLEANKQAFALAFVQRAGFPTSNDATTFVNTLFANAGVNPTSGERTAAINAFNAAGGGNAGRAAALRSVVDSASMSNALFNESFVLMEYFGYLQRDPDAAPEATRDYQGFQFWLNKLNAFGGNYINAEMVKAFITSTEYRARFGNP